MTDNLRNWRFMAYIAGLIFIGGMTWADNQTQNATLAEHATKLAEDDRREQTDAIAAAVLQSDVEGIKDDVHDIKLDIKEILHAIRQK